jgi:ABC-2 type transport system ATP-binding protein
MTAHLATGPGPAGAGNVVETTGLGKRYGRTWALRDCTLAVPAGHVTALVGANGAGKSTLLHLVVGLARASAGQVRVLDGQLPGSPPALARIGFVAQDSPLYRNLSVTDTLRLAASLNRRWDGAYARARLAELDIPLDRRVGRLSGGQQAQVALAVALAKRPDLVLLDEPVARLDPLARHEFTAALMAAVAEDGLSVLLSSHVLAELSRVCDHLVLLAGGRVQVTGEVDALLAGHRILSGPAERADAVAARSPVVADQRGGRQARLLVRTGPASGGAGPGLAAALPPGWQAEPVGLEELVLAYLREPAAATLPGPRPLTPTVTR